MKAPDPDRLVACYGALAAWVLLLLVVIRHLVGVRTFVLSVFLPTPLSAPILIVVLPLVVIGVGLFAAANVYTFHRGSRSRAGFPLWTGTWVAFLLFANSIAEVDGRLVLSGTQLEIVLWTWGLAVLLFTWSWFRRPRRRATPG